MFGCIYYIYVPSEKTTKLEEKVERGIFVGYNNFSKGFWIFNFQTRQLVVSRDVKFIENASWDWEAKKVIKQSVGVPFESIIEEETKNEARDSQQIETKNSRADQLSSDHSDEDSSFESPIRRTR